MSTPAFSAVDDETCDLLSLVADVGHVSADYEWSHFVKVLEGTAGFYGGRIDQNHVRELLRGAVAPRRIGAFYNRAASQGLIRATGDWSVSADTCGRNSGKPTRVYVWVGEQS